MVQVLNYVAAREGGLRLQGGDVMQHTRAVLEEKRYEEAYLRDAAQQAMIAGSPLLLPNYDLNLPLDKLLDVVSVLLALAVVQHARLPAASMQKGSVYGSVMQTCR